jgi:hypothetical protein
LLNNIPAWLETSNDNLDKLETWARARRLPLNLKAISNRLILASKVKFKYWQLKPLDLR